MPEADLEIASLSPDGRGVARCGDPRLPELAGLVVFVAGALPGQLARVAILKRKKNYAEGRALSILRDDPSLESPFCARGAACGGCPLQRLPYRRQLATKAAFAKDALKKFSGLEGAFIDAVSEAPLPSPALERFRNKMEFSFGTDESGSLILGQRAQASHAVARLGSCPLLPQGHEEILAAMENEARVSGLPAWRPGCARGEKRRDSGFWRFFTLRHDAGGGWLAVCGTSRGGRRERALVREMAARMKGASPGLIGFIHEEHAASRSSRHAGERIFSLGETTLSQNIGGRLFRLDAASFSQVNPAGADLLASLILEMTVGDSGGALLDLYCGTGAPGALLAPRFRELCGVESNPASIRLARENAPANCRYEAADAEKFLAGSSGRWHTILADPPRAGLGGAAREISRLNPKQIIYVSCNPATFARDAGLLGATHKLERLAAVDLFPHTPHLELASRWISRALP